MLHSRGIVCRRQWSASVHYVSYSQSKSWGGKGPLEIISPCSKESQLQQGCSEMCRVGVWTSLWIEHLTASRGCIIKWPQRFMAVGCRLLKAHTFLNIHSCPSTYFIHCLFPGGHLEPGSWLPKPALLGWPKPPLLSLHWACVLMLSSKEVDGSRQMPGSTSQLLWCNFQPLQVKEPLYHQRRINWFAYFGPR